MKPAKITKKARSEKLVTSVAKATGIKEADVAKILDHLGFKDVLDAAESHAGSVEAKIALKLGKRLTVV